jgi:hypothetical protein
MTDRSAHAASAAEYRSQASASENAPFAMEMVGQTPRQSNARKSSTTPPYC